MKYEGPFLIVWKSADGEGQHAAVWHPLFFSPIENYIKATSDKMWVTNKEGKILTLEDIK